MISKTWFRRLINRLKTKGSFSQQTLSTLSTQILALFVALFNAGIIARWLGPDGKGTLQLALMLPAILGLVFNGGIGISNVYYTGSRQFDISTLSTNSMAFVFISLPIGLILIGALFISGWLSKLLPGIPNWAILLVLAAFPTELLLNYFNGILQGERLIPLLNAIQLGRSIFILLFTIILVIGADWGLLGALIAPLLSGLIALSYAMVIIRRRGGVFIPKWNVPIMRETLKFGMKGYVGNLLQFFNYRLDIFLVNFFLGPASVGIYGVSIRLAELLWQFSQAVSFVIFPKAASTSSAEMNQFTPRITALVLLVCTLGAIGLAAFGNLLITLIYSSAFSEAYMPMLILLPGVVLLGGTKVLANEIAGRGYPQYNSIISGTTLVITIILDLALIPTYGIAGASLASSIAYILTFCMAIWFYNVVKVKKRIILSNPSL